MPDQLPLPATGSAVPTGAHPVFGGWAELYLRFRPSYPPEVFAPFAAATGARGLCVELGAGSGQATGAALALFEQVVALEPDAEMAALIPVDPRLAVVTLPAEDATFAPGTVAGVLAANALHWMDAGGVVARAAHWLQPGGVFLAFATRRAQYPDAPAAVTRILQDHLSEARAHTHARLTDWRPYEEILAESRAFARVEPLQLTAEHRWPPRQAAGFLMSMSCGQALAQASGDAGAYLNAFADALEAAAQGRDIRVRIPIEGAFGVR